MIRFYAAFNFAFELCLKKCSDFVKIGVLFLAKYVIGSHTDFFTDNDFCPYLFLDFAPEGARFLVDAIATVLG